MLSVAEKSLPKRRSSTKVRKNTRKPKKSGLTTVVMQ